MSYACDGYHRRDSEQITVFEWEDNHRQIHVCRPREGAPAQAVVCVAEGYEYEPTPLTVDQLVELAGHLAHAAAILRANQ